MIGLLIKKVFFKKAEKSEKEKKTLINSLGEKSKQISNAFEEKIEEVKDELLTMKEKLGNLLETNYNLGLFHLENGNLSDATFRFRFIKKFWPNHHDSFFQLAYCLVLGKKTSEARKVLIELLSKDPNHQQGQELLKLIDSNFGIENSASQSS
jgi:tetratricopeptide (TPR) repeat protein